MYIHKGVENSNTEEKKPKDDVNYVHHHRLLIRSYVRTVRTFLCPTPKYIRTYISLPYLLYTHLGIEEQSHARGWPRSQAVHKLV